MHHPTMVGHTQHKSVTSLIASKVWACKLGMNWLDALVTLNAEGAGHSICCGTKCCKGHATAAIFWIHLFRCGTALLCLIIIQQELAIFSPTAFQGTRSCQAGKVVWQLKAASSVHSTENREKHSTSMKSKNWLPVVASLPGSPGGSFSG